MRLNSRGKRPKDFTSKVKSAFKEKTYFKAEVEGSRFLTEADAWLQLRVVKLFLRARARLVKKITSFETELKNEARKFWREDSNL